MQRSIRLLTFFMIIPLHTYGAESSAGSSPVVSRVSGIINNGLNWLYKTVDPYYPMVSDEYLTGSETVTSLKAKEVAMELDFATINAQIYRAYTADYDITTRFPDRAGPTNRRLVEWLASGNSQQLKACHDCIYNLSPLFRLLLERYWAEHEMYRPTPIERRDFGVFENVNPFLSQSERPALILEDTIQNMKKFLVAESGISAAERTRYKHQYPEDFLLNMREKPKHEAVYETYIALVELARINKQPPVAELAQQIQQLFHQIACREFYIRGVALTLLQSGAFDRMKTLYQIHGKNIPPVLAVIICGMLRANCIDAKDYLPPAYVNYYDTQDTPSHAGIDPMLFKAANKFIFLFCSDLTTGERGKLYGASASVLASSNKPAAIWPCITYTETRRSLLTRIDQTGKMPELFARLNQFIQTTSPALAVRSSQDMPSAPLYPTSASVGIPLPAASWDINTMGPVAAGKTPPDLQKFEFLQDGFIHQRLSPRLASPSDSLPPLLELPEEFIPAPAQLQ